MGRRRATAPAAISLPTPSSFTAPLATPQAPPNTPSGAAQPPAPPSRRQPVLLSRPAPSRGARCAEVAGSTAADCAAVCCCCPCGILNLLVLAVVKLPAGLCRRAFVNQKKKKKLNASRRSKASPAGSFSATTRRGLLRSSVGDARDDEDDDEFIVFGAGGPLVVGPGAKGLLLGAAVGWPANTSPSQEVLEMDKQMWAHFYGGGFWRSPSQKEV